MQDIKYLRRLSNEYENVMAARAEIIDLRAILALPKGTEYFFSDLHGEHEAFIHMLRSASGTIKQKIDEHFSNEIDEVEREKLASLCYDPKSEIERAKSTEKDYLDWCFNAIYRLIIICKSVSTKYTRHKVRKRLPKYMDYSMDELLHADDEENRRNYYNKIITSIINEGEAERYIIALTDSIYSLAVDRLHIIGDIFDRGPHPDKIFEFLMNFHDVDIEWGNHDVVWMGAAVGNWACICNVLRMNISYNNFDVLEVGYGINLRPLATLAENVYKDDPCTYFIPHLIEENKFDPVDPMLAAKMNKAISICQFKIEGQRIKAHPEYKLDNRLLLDKIDFKKGTVLVEGKTYPLRDTYFPTIDPDNPYELSSEEKALMEALYASFVNSEKLQRHISFLFNHGALYKVVNGNILYHGCIPANEDGSLREVEVSNGLKLKGKDLLDYFDSEVRNAYYTPEKMKETGYVGDIMWYLWLGYDSPLFGKEKMTTFERLFIEDKASHKEPPRPYYHLRNEKEFCETILKEFKLNTRTGKILNGHVPVKFKDGESPIKGEGLLYVIDGGMSKAYQKETGIAGYTFIYNSRFMALAEHKPYSPIALDGTQIFRSPKIVVVDNLPKRVLVEDTDNGEELIEKINDLEELIKCYKEGLIKEKY